MRRMSLTKIVNFSFGWLVGWSLLFTYGHHQPEDEKEKYHIPSRYVSSVKWSLCCSYCVILIYKYEHGKNEKIQGKQPPPTIQRTKTVVQFISIFDLINGKLNVYNISKRLKYIRLEISNKSSCSLVMNIVCHLECHRTHFHTVAFCTQAQTDTHTHTQFKWTLSNSHETEKINGFFHCDPDNAKLSSANEHKHRRSKITFNLFIHTNTVMATVLCLCVRANAF